MNQGDALAKDGMSFAALVGLRDRLSRHELYSRLTTTRNIAIFMKHHVWAVWDFMSLVKALQRQLTGIDLPWRPVGDPEIRFLINDIVVGEESDLDRHGRRTSHFEMYLEAMKGVGATTRRIEQFVALLSQGETVERSLELVGAPAASASFVRKTFAVIGRGQVHEIASLFTYGREDIIPSMFIGMLDRLEVEEGVDLTDLRYYLERHIEVDGGHHGPLARRMVELLCRGEERLRAEAIEAALLALEARVELWDAIVAKFDQVEGDD